MYVTYRVKKVSLLKFSLGLFLPLSFKNDEENVMKIIAIWMLYVQNMKQPKTCVFILLSPYFNIFMLLYYISAEQMAASSWQRYFTSLGRMMMVQSPINPMADSGWKRHIRSLLLTRLCKSRCVFFFTDSFESFFNLNMRHSHVCHFESHHKSSLCPPMIPPSAKRAFTFFTWKISTTPRNNLFSIKNTHMRQDIRYDTWSLFSPGDQVTAQKLGTVCSAAPGDVGAAIPAPRAPPWNGQSVLLAACNGSENYTMAHSHFARCTAWKCSDFLYIVIPNNFSIKTTTKKR